MPDEQVPPGDDTPESPICLFLGAGASVAAGVPTTFDFVSKIGEALQTEPDVRSLFDEIMDTLRAGAGREGFPGSGVDVERLLESVSLLRDSPSPVTALFGPPLLGRYLDRGKLSALEAAIRKIVRRECIVEASKTRYFSPLIRLVQTYGPLDIFTTNYDVVLDQFSAWSGLPLVDGLAMGWNPQLFESRVGLRIFLYRLHGAVTWYRSTSFGFLKLPLREGDDGLVFLSGEKAQALLLYPAEKEVMYSPLVHCLNALHAKLRSTPWWLVVGSTFRDEQLLGAFQEAAAENQALRVLLVSPDAEQVYQEKLARRSRDGVPSPFDKDLYSNRVLRLPYRFENSFDEIASTVLPRYMDTVRFEETYRMNEIWKGQTDWAKVALGYADIGLLDPLQSLERDKLQNLKPDINWTVQYRAYRALHEWETGDDLTARTDWAQTSAALAKLRSWSPRIDVYGDPPFWVRPTFGYTERTLIQTPPERTVGYPYSCDSVATLLDDVWKVADRISRCSARSGTAEAFGLWARRLKALVDYLRVFGTNGITGLDYVSYRAGDLPEEAAAVRAIVESGKPEERDQRREAFRKKVESIEVPRIDDLFRGLESYPEVRS
jgi:hypothetical protein